MRTTRRATLAFTAAAFAVLLVHTGASADDVTTTAGKKINGKLVSVDEKGVTFSTGEAKVPIPSRDIVVVDLGNAVRPLPKDTGYHELELTDGSVVRFVKGTLKDKKFEGEQLPTPAGVAAPTYDIPMRTVFSFMKKADDAKHREAWQKMLATRGKRDLYVIEQATGLTFIQGTIHSGTSDGVEINFEKEGGTVGETEKLRQNRSAGFVFYQPQPATIAPTICRVTDVYGNSLNATAIVITPEGVTVTTVAGATVKYASTQALAQLNYQLGNVAYLSDLNPQVDSPEIAMEERRLNPTVAFLKDRSLSNDLLKLDNVNYPKGLCVAPDTALTYNLKGDYSQFKATVGIDENGANATSAAKLIIEADGQVLYSATLHRKEKAKGVVLSVKGVKQLRLIVEADTPLNGNYVTLAEVRVQK